MMRQSGDLQVLCDLGTDCADCGPWTFQLPPGEKKVSKPIELLREHKVTVNIAQTATQPSFLMPYTNPEQDIDVSQQMAHQQVVELGLTQVRWTIGHPVSSSVQALPVLPVSKVGTQPGILC